MDYVFYLLVALAVIAAILLFVGIEQYTSFVLDGVGDISRILFKIIVGISVFMFCLSVGILQNT